ncbi:hypothetical protein J9B83_01155 [Marinomonas sp. A79]|uniref:Uncharacterized protein n=1 Tax=Marinomonas vulgaris TaxID=2823372 RepID=A0ABS5H7M5_9GAMM|nr:hypothetical protein [Marinomonas vulgaris]MBR7887530.1 hypothetical protein [Marinomonas vulgaris]
MIFVEAINKTITQPNGKKWLTKNKYRPAGHHQDSVELSSAAHEVKEIFLDSEESTPLTASSSIFANLVEHVLSHVFNDSLHLHSPEELMLDQKSWALFLQVPPSNETNNKSPSYLTPEGYKPPISKQLIFHIPVKPFYGNTLDMTLLMSSHNGSPKPPEFFATHPKETTLPILRTPYSPEFLAQQTSHFHIFLDQDGEPDQLSPLYSHVNQSRLTEQNTSPNITGLRVWRAKKNILTPAVLGDNRIGLLFVGHYSPLTGNTISEETRSRQANNLYTKA